MHLKYHSFAIVESTEGAKKSSVMQGKRGLFDLSKMSAFGPIVMDVSQENAHSFSGISRFLSDSVGP